MACCGADKVCGLVVQHLSSRHKQQVEEYVQQRQQQQRTLPWDLYGLTDDEEEERKGPLCSSAVRALHPVSRHCCSTARAGLTHLRLDRYRQAQPTGRQLYNGPGVRLPWGLLAEASAATAISLRVWHVPALLAGPRETVAALTGRLTALEVSGVGDGEAAYPRCGDPTKNHSRSSSGHAQVAALGRLLVACTRLQALSVSGILFQEYRPVLEAELVKGASSSSSSSSSRHSLSSSLATGGHIRKAGSQQGLPAAKPYTATSASSGCGQPLPLLHLQLSRFPHGPFFAWLRRRGQLAQLRSLALIDTTNAGCSWADLSGLQELEVGYRVMSAGDYPVHGLAALRGSLTRLSLDNCGLADSWWRQPDLPAMTSLRRLELSSVSYDTRWLAPLRQLTHLWIDTTRSGLPAGQWVSSVEELTFMTGRPLRTLPTGLTRLTQLKVEARGWSPGVLSTVAGATSLRHLDLTHCELTHLSWLTALSQLEVLELAWTKPGPEVLSDAWSEEDMEQQQGSDSGDEEGLSEQGTEQISGSGDVEGSNQQDRPAVSVQQLVNLRHLGMTASRWEVADVATLCRGAQRLTSLNLSSRDSWGEGTVLIDPGNLPDLGVLPSLRELSLAGVAFELSHWPAVGGWLGLQSRLVVLNLQSTPAPNTQAGVQQQLRGLAQLPTQLQQLDLRHCGLRKLPRCLSRLTALRVLLAGGNWQLPAVLPAWLPALQQLEVLGVQLADDEGDQGVNLVLSHPLLSLLPRLRVLNADEHERVSLPWHDRL